MRLGFAVAAFLDSDILVVDEVLAVGDAEFQSKAISKMDEVTKKQQKTVIFVSHNMDSIKKLCSRVMIMKEGKVHDFGKTNEMIKKYLSKNNNILKTMGIKKFDKNNAPGGSIIKLDFISTKTTKGEIRHDFKVSDEVVVEFGFYVKDENHQICSCLIFSKDGVSIFETMDNYVKNKWGNQKNLEKGYYKSQCILPSNLFNYGTFDINIVIFLPPGDMESSHQVMYPIRSSGAISFNIEDDNQINNPKGTYPYTLSKHPSIRLQPNWKTNLIQN